MASKIKGDEYETYIRDYLLSKDYVVKNNIQNVWLWKDIPLEMLHESGFVNDFNEERLKRKNKINENPFQDTGVDILQLNNLQEFALIQCKNYTGTIPMESFGGFFMHLFAHMNKKGIIYHTSMVTTKLKF
jgi:predicted helicase